MGTKRKPVGRETTRNFVVEDYKDPPKRLVKGYRSKKTDDGHVLTFAILRKKGPRGGRTALVNIKHPKKEKGRARRA